VRTSVSPITQSPLYGMVVFRQVSDHVRVGGGSGSRHRRGDNVWSFSEIADAIRRDEELAKGQEGKSINRTITVSNGTSPWTKIGV
jgi:hypothetical protein